MVKVCVGSEGDQPNQAIEIHQGELNKKLSLPPEKVPKPNVAADRESAVGRYLWLLPLVTPQALDPVLDPADQKSYPLRPDH